MVFFKKKIFFSRIADDIAEDGVTCNFYLIHAQSRKAVEVETNEPCCDNAFEPKNCFVNHQSRILNSWQQTK